MLSKLSQAIISCILAILLTACAAHKQTDIIYEPPPPPPLVLTSINIIDRNGMTETITTKERLEQYSTVDFLSPQSYQKVLRVFNRDIQGNIHSIITSYHPNGQPRQYLEVVNSRANGSYQEWHANGFQKIDATVIGGIADIVDGAEQTWLFDGYCNVWDENGRLQASIPYTSGQLEGVSTYYHTNGIIWKNVPYHKNKIHGTFDIFQEDGSLLQRTNYQNGLKEGESLRYWCEGQLAVSEDYCDGHLATGRYFSLDGQCIAQIDEGKGTRAIFSRDGLAELHTYINGIQDGQIQVFDKHNRIIKIYHMKNDVKQGEEILYYDAPRLKKVLTPKISISWFDGKMQGLVKTWYPNEMLESQKEMSNNKKNGLSSVWYEDGSLMMIEEYNADKLVKGEYYLKGETTSVSTVIDGKGTVTLFGPDGTFQRKILYINGKPIIED